jgi:hypothetical protein
MEGALMDATDKLTELTESVTSLLGEVKRVDDMLFRANAMYGDFLTTVGRQSNASDAIRSRVIDIGDKLAQHDQRFDRIDEVLRQLLDKVVTT